LAGLIPVLLLIALVGALSAFWILTALLLTALLLAALLLTALLVTLTGILIRILVHTISSRDAARRPTNANEAPFDTERPSA
jgi:hypothetical protein